MIDGAMLVSGRDKFEMTADLVSAFVSNNNVPVSELPALIASVHAALAGLGKEAVAEPADPGEADAPPRSESRSCLTRLISFEDGKSYKTLKRHLTLRGLTPEGYRAKYGLPADYPMTTANYSAQRSALAHCLGPRSAATQGSSLRLRRGSLRQHPKARGRKKATETA